MRKLIGALAVIFLSIFAFNLYKYKKDVPKERVVQEALTDMGADEDTINALDDTIQTIQNTSASISEAKQLITDAMSGEIISELGETLSERPEVSEETALMLKEEVTTELKQRAEELPYFTDEDIDEMATQIAIRVSNACDEDRIREMVEGQDLKGFNENLANEVVKEKYGFIGKFMEKWINNMPNINDIDNSGY